MAAQTDQDPKHTNRLVRETSPYLLQHAHNPVDWYPWGDEAFEAAKREDKPIFLSIGYSSCHWCHVMERESFESEAVAEVLNRDFIPVKVDREERPDLDEIYMTAVQLLTQRGGWPMSTWLLPDGRPFYGGTYYPAEHFTQLLHNIAEAYRTRRRDLTAQAQQLTEYMAEVNSAGEPGEGTISRALIENAISRMGSRFDESYGGFGSAPKFPPSTGIPLLLHEYERSRRADAIRWTTKTLDAMALGGIHDHLGGGFHRYSTDRHWLLPHFEKMLYDNGQLSRIYAEAHRVTGRPEYRIIAEEVYDWVLREMTGEEGAFYSTLDADSEGEEGKFYVWGHSEVMEVLGPDDGALFCRVYTILPGGNFNDEATRRPSGHNIPHLTKPLSEHAREAGQPLDVLSARLAEMRARLLAVRVRRVWPGLDDKILTAWNGLMIGSFARGGQILDRPDYVQAASRAADFVLNRMRRDGRLLRTYRNGEARLAAYLEDYGIFCHALLDLHAATGEERWLSEARTLMDQMVQYFWDEANGGFYNTASDHEAILLRTKSSYDQAMPSGNAMAALSLLRLAEATGERAYLDRARALLGAFLGLMEQNPMGTETLILAAARYLEAAAQAGVPEPEAEPATAALQSDTVDASVELTATHVPRGGKTTARVTLEIAEGWHVNSFEPLQEYLEPTEIRVSGGPSVTVGMGRAPEPQRVRLDFSEEPLSVYVGTVTWDIPLRVSPDATPGQTPVWVYIDFQACNNEACSQPTTIMLETPLTITE